MVGCLINWFFLSSFFHGLKRKTNRSSRKEEKSKKLVKRKEKRKKESHGNAEGSKGRKGGLRGDRRNRHGSSKKKSAGDSEESVYKPFDDPGFLGGDPIAMLTIDSDLILGSPPDSPSVIHARWGEPVDDPDEQGVCHEFKPNPFKLGFCVNCQKQHDIAESGEVVEKKKFKKIARPAVAKTATSALDNPAALKNATYHHKESDVDLALLLKHRRDTLLELSKLEKEKAKRSASPRDRGQ
jgi:hypothetical protein